MVEGKIFLSIATTCVVMLCKLFWKVSGQNAIQVIASTDTYPMFKVECGQVNIVNNCQCQPGISEQPWSLWSKCKGSGDFYQCHNGIKFRRKSCGTCRQTNNCTIREWRRCYHPESCKGSWVNWIDPTDNTCSKSCGGGVRTKLELCMLDKRRVGMFCIHNRRKPYKITHERCNNQSCPQLTTTTRSQFTQRSTMGFEDGDNQAASSDFKLNTVAWILIGIAAVLLIALFVSWLCLCRCGKNGLKQPYAPEAVSNNMTNYNEQAVNGQALDEEESAYAFATNDAVATSRPASRNVQEPINTPLLVPPQAPPVLNGSFAEVGGHVILTQPASSKISRENSYMKSLHNTHDNSLSKVKSNNYESSLTKPAPTGSIALEPIHGSFNTNDLHDDERHHVYDEIRETKWN